MKVLFIRSNPVRPDSRVEKEVFCLKDNGYDVKVFAWDRDSNYPIFEEKLKRNNLTIPIYRTGIKSQYGSGKKNLFSLLRFQIKIIIFIFKNRKNIDIIHACDLDTGAVSLLMSKILKKKIVYDIFDYYSDSHGITGYMNNFVSKFENMIINKSEATIICSEERKQQIRGSKPQRLVIIHNTPELDLMSPNPKFNIEKNDKFKICYVGILAQSRMIKEMVEIVAQNQNYELHIGGFGPLEKYVRQQSEKHSNIFFYGVLAYEDTLSLESQCDVIPALYSPTIANHKYAAPNKFYEGLMLGKPLIMIKETGMSDIVLENDIGEVIDYNKKDLQKAFKKLSNMRNQDNEYISDTMNRIYTTKYSWDKMRERLIDLYRGLR